MAITYRKRAYCTDTRLRMRRGRLALKYADLDDLAVSWCDGVHYLELLRDRSWPSTVTKHFCSRSLARFYIIL